MNKITKWPPLDAIVIRIDNRVAYGTMLPYKKYISTLRCSQKTLDMLQAFMRKPRSAGKTYMVKSLRDATAKRDRLSILGVAGFK